MLLKGCQDRASLSRDSDNVECRIGLSVCRDEMMDEIEVRPMDNNNMRDPLKGVKQCEQNYVGLVVSQYCRFVGLCRSRSRKMRRQVGPDAR